MMTYEERDQLEALPDVVTIYRGCYQNNKHGLSWSLSKEIAEKFPLLNRYWRPTEQPYLVTAKVNKDDIIALKNDRGESEVITYRPKHFSTRRIKQRPLIEPKKGITVGELILEMEAESSISKPKANASKGSRA
jgi:hypothetical protein